MEVVNIDRRFPEGPTLSAEDFIKDSKERVDNLEQATITAKETLRRAEWLAKQVPYTLKFNRKGIIFTENFQVLGEELFPKKGYEIQVGEMFSGWYDTPGQPDGGRVEYHFFPQFWVDRSLDFSSRIFIRPEDFSNYIPQATLYALQIQVEKGGRGERVYLDNINELTPPSLDNVKSYFQERGFPKKIIAMLDKEAELVDDMPRIKKTALEFVAELKTAQMREKLGI